MSLPQGSEQVKRDTRLSGSRLPAHLHQLVRHPGHGAYHHHRSLWATAGYNRCHSLDGFRALNRSPAELHYNHAHTLYKTFIRLFPPAKFAATNEKPSDRWLDLAVG